MWWIYVSVGHSINNQKWSCIEAICPIQGALKSLLCTNMATCCLLVVYMQFKFNGYSGWTSSFLLVFTLYEIYIQPVMISDNGCVCFDLSYHYYCYTLKGYKMIFCVWMWGCGCLDFFQTYESDWRREWCSIKHPRKPSSQDTNPKPRPKH